MLRSQIVRFIEDAKILKDLKTPDILDLFLINLVLDGVVEEKNSIPILESKLLKELKLNDRLIFILKAYLFLHLKKTTGYEKFTEKFEQ